MSAQKESFKPFLLRGPDQGVFLWGLRQILDLQLRTICLFLRPKLKKMDGVILDVGAGLSPWRSYLPGSAQYWGIDVAIPEFGFPQRHDIQYFQGKVFPRNDNTFDSVLCTEVLEHTQDPDSVLQEIHRVLKPGGQLILTVPFSARAHFLPHDYRRWTKNGLQQLLENHGFEIREISERGNDLTSISNKLIVLMMRSLKARALFIGVLFLPVVILFLALAHLSLELASWLDFGGSEDPLGYGVVAIKVI